MVGPKAKRPGKGENEKKNIEGKVQKKLDNQKATGFTYVDTSVTPTTTIFQAVMEQAVWQRYEGHNNPFFQEIRLRRRDGEWIQSSDFMNFWTKRKCYRGAVFFFLPKNVFKILFRRTNEKIHPQGMLFHHRLPPFHCSMWRRKRII